jgi:hypothetical protein
MEIIIIVVLNVAKKCHQNNIRNNLTERRNKMKKKIEYIFDHKFNSNITITIRAYNSDDAIYLLGKLVSNISDYVLFAKVNKYF